jgi:hypothetical protein
MSIIHDALKKVQEGLAPKIETLTREGEQTADQKPPTDNKIKSIFAVSCALVITAASILYIYQQFQNNNPQFNSFAKKSFYQLIHKGKPLAAKTEAPENLKPLAQFSVNPPPGPPMTKQPAPTTFNIHGIMSNKTGNLVLINDQVYQEGDVVDGTKIVKINLNSVTVITDGIQQTILVKN